MGQLEHQISAPLHAVAVYGELNLRDDKEHEREPYGYQEGLSA